MKVACRWPGGITLAVPKASGLHVTHHVNGPAGQPSVGILEFGAKPPSKYAATAAQKAIADTVHRMKETQNDDYAPHEYGVTHIPGDFWNEWYAINQNFDVVTKDMVFALE